MPCSSSPALGDAVLRSTAQRLDQNVATLCLDTHGFHNDVPGLTHVCRTHRALPRGELTVRSSSHALQVQPGPPTAATLEPEPRPGQPLTATNGPDLSGRTLLSGVAVQLRDAYGNAAALDWVAVRWALGWARQGAEEEGQEEDVAAVAAAAEAQGAALPELQVGAKHLRLNCTVRVSAVIGAGAGAGWRQHKDHAACQEAHLAEACQLQWRVALRCLTLPHCYSVRRYPRLPPCRAAPPPSPSRCSAPPTPAAECSSGSWRWRRAAAVWEGREMDRCVWGRWEGKTQVLARCGLRVGVELWMRALAGQCR